MPTRGQIATHTEYRVLIDGMEPYAPFDITVRPDAAEGHAEFLRSLGHDTVVETRDVTVTVVYGSWRTR